MAPHAHQHANKHQAVRKYAPWLVIIGLALPAMLLVDAMKGAVIMIAILAANTALEMHKIWTAGIPVDLELLTLGTAYLAASGHVVWALILAFTGPVCSEAARGHICTGSTFRPFALLAVVMVAPLFGPTAWGLMAAVVVGAIANWVRVLLTTGADPVASAISRTTQVLFAGHIIFMLL
jgi:hypothetical protein